jgi:uncharacterized RDD family membrane protein YckC
MNDITVARIVAFLIDYLIFIGCFILYMRGVGEPMENGGYQVTGFLGLAVPLFWALWFVIPESLAGATLGKFICGARVQKVSGGRLGLIPAFVRRFFDLFDFWSCFGLVAFVCHINLPQGRRVGDLASGAVVVLRSKTPNQSPEPTPQSGVAHH